MQSKRVNPIPNIVTGLNLITGCVAISMAIQENYNLAAYLIILSSVFDFLDGMLAKLLNATSEFGKVFDSIVDMVSFGVAPGVLMYKIMIVSLTYNDATFNVETADFPEYLIMMSAFLVTLFVAIRLAKFTASDDQTNEFKGLPSPAAAILMASISYIAINISSFQDFIFDNIRLLAIIMITSILMVVNLPMMKMKFNGTKIKDNFMKYIFIVGTIVLLIAFKFAGIPLIILLYIILSIVNTLIKEPAS